MIGRSNNDLERAVTLNVHVYIGIRVHLKKNINACELIWKGNCWDMPANLREKFCLLHLIQESIVLAVEGAGSQV